METKYDGYYEREMPYRMTMEELQSLDYMGEEEILAYMRHIRIDNLLIKAKTHFPKNMIVTGFLPGIALCSGNKECSICKIVNDEDLMYNPFIERDDGFDRDHLSSPYKIKFTSIEFDGVIETMYFSDFCSLVKEGKIELIESYNHGF